jgi:NADH:ubiquinone oxidoreductase subunit E
VKRKDTKLAAIVKGRSVEKGGLVGVLQDVQNHYTYLPKAALSYISEELDIPLSQVYSLATYYKAFSLKPRGKYVISLCMGTACHVRGAGRIADEIKKKLDIKTGETTHDGLFTFETVNCLGCCAIGPVMMIDDVYYGELTAKKVDAILKKYRTGGTRETRSRKK